MFSLISCIGKNREIGKKGQLVFNIKDDMKFFRETTTNHQVVMGHNTWKSLPGKLKNRTNIVVCNQDIPEADLVILDLPEFIAKYKDTPEEIFVIGGGMIYREFLPHAKHLYLTEVSATDPDADTFFPAFNKKEYKKALIRKGSENGLDYSIYKYSKT